MFGEYRAPDRVSAGAAPGPGTVGWSPSWRATRARAPARELGGRIRLLVGKPGLDGHSNGAEQIALAARDAGFEVVYAGIRQTPAQLVAAAVEEDVHCVGVSVLSGAHLGSCRRSSTACGSRGGRRPVVVGGVVPPEDAGELLARGAAAVFTPADHDLGLVLVRVVEVVRVSRGLPPLQRLSAPSGSPGGLAPARP